MVKDFMTMSWTALLVRGILGAIFGVLAMIWPLSTALALVLLWGFWALVDGVASIGHAFKAPGWGARAGLIALGALSLIAAFLAITSPGLTAVALTWVLGVWLVVRGLFEIFGAFSSTAPTSRWVLVLGGLLDGAIGLIFMFNPGSSALALAFVIGLMAFVWGLLFIGLAVAVHRAEKGATGISPTAATT